ncbi:MAG: cadmium-translocating P-type ATPase [Lachnospiraceae bacterium]|nr:cadmium-translocating P-type ATPase [Lachnospiraceae bacterium]
MNRKQKKNLKRIIISLVLLVLCEIALDEGIIKNIAYTVIYFIIGYDILKKVTKSIKNKQIFDENFLMAVATIGAMLLNEFREGVAVMLLYQIGELFQSYAVGKSRKNIYELMDIRPDYANIEQDGKLVKVSPDEVKKGSIIVVKSGEKIPIDGVIVEGESSLNTSALTGESMLRDVTVNDMVTSGCINMSGVLKIRTDREFGESTVSKILELVENASSKKSESEKFITKFARYYTPAVCITALVLAIIPPVLLMVIGKAPLWGIWIYRALTFLVISCPCALVISIPLGFFACIGGASRDGILIKGSNYIETLSRVKNIAFDKTGTITKGEFKVSSINNNTIEEDKVIFYAAYAECFSSHPIAKSLRDAYGKEINENRVSEVKELGGKGITAKVDEDIVAVGNIRLCEEMGISVDNGIISGTSVHVIVNGKYAGLIVITDVIKEQAGDTINKLKNYGINTYMISGDVKAVADDIAEKVGIDNVYCELMPEDKVKIVESIIEKQENNETTAFVGDGINDAPVLSMADVGIAMGALGSDAAIEAADIVLMDDNPFGVVKAINKAKRCMKIVYENIYFSIGVKLLCLILSTVGLANMWAAIFADVGVMILAVLNSIRLLIHINKKG